MIANFLLQRPKILLSLIVFIIIAGASSYWVLPQLEDPVLGQRVGVVSTVFPGADTRSVEQLVTNRIEDRLTGVADVQRIRSNSRAGISNIVIELSDDITDVQPSWDRVRDVVEDVQDELPSGCLSPALDVFPLKAFASIVAVKSRDPQRIGLNVVRRIAASLSREVSAIAGTEAVETFGDPGEEFLVQVDAEVLSSMGLTVGGVANQLTQSLTAQPAGVLRSDQTELLLDLSADRASAKRLKASPIRVGQRGETVRLADIASVEKTLVSPASDRAIIDKQNAIVIGAMVDDRLGVAQWTESLEEVLARFQQNYDAEIEIEMLFSQQQFIEDRLRQLTESLLIGTLLVIFVVLLMMGWRSMIVVVAALPLSAALVITGMRWLEIPLHQMSVTGLIVALGLLIDNAIVMVEDIRQRLVKLNVSAAIVQSIAHLRMPLLGSTLTTTFAFLPIATLPGPPGEFVGTIAVSVILAIVASFVLAMTVIPALYAVLSDGAREGVEEDVSAAGGVYHSFLKLFLGFPVLGILVSVILPATGFLVANQLPVQFFPASNRKQVQIEIEVPAASAITKTVATVSQIQPLIEVNSGVKDVHWFVGRSAPTFYYNVVPRRRGTPFYAQGIVDLNTDADAEAVVAAIQGTIQDQVRDCRVVVRQLEQGPPFDAPIELQIQGPNLDVLKMLGNQVRLVLSQCANVTQTRSDLGETIPKLVLDVDDDSATQAGVDRASIARQLYARLEGVTAATLYDGNQALPVRVVAERDGNGLTGLSSLEISAEPPAPAQRSPFASMANFRLSSDVGAIVHINGKRTNEIKAYLSAGVLPDRVLGNFKRRLAASDFILPAGYELKFGGENQKRTEAVERLISNGFVLFALMVLTLVVSFGSLRHALIVIGVGGLSMGLGPLALWVGGFPFGFMAIVGTMGLVGIAINDSIVVLAAIAEDDKASGGDVDATCGVVIGCTRHVVATTLTTIAGFVPLIVAGGKFWPPLAVTIAGGVGGATLMALLLAPALHLLLVGNRKI